MTLSRSRARRPLRLDSLEAREVPADVSAPAILQWFEGTYASIERRAADVFAAGYGNVYTPPPGRADSGNQSVGYDVYDRFDLGGPGRPTLYGTEAGLKAAIAAIHRLGATWTIDFVANHNGFSDQGTSGFTASGGYPGFLLTSQSHVDGDFHSAFAGGDLEGRLAGLIDIDQDTNFQFIRSPVDANDNRNLPPGTTPAFGRLANVADPNNRRFYPDQGLDPIFVFDPATGESGIPIHPFNTGSPMSGDATPENALGYLMRNAQWLVQAIGVDNLRLDAVKHFERYVLNFLDRAVYRSNPRRLLDGSQQNVFMFGEAFDGSKPFLQEFIRKDINPNDPGRVGGNRDVLDFPLFFAMNANLTGNGFANDWRNITNASQDSHDDGFANNGSQGVSFAGSHDEHGPHLSNVAHAFTLMRPGNAIVYFNAQEFGDGRDFPKDGRGDALGGLYGDVLTKLVNIRNTHGRGNYIERFVEKEFLVFEREKSALVILSNRTDGGFDSRTVQTSFAPGTLLYELTGNAADPIVDPFNDFPEVLQVNGDGTVNIRVPRNTSHNGTNHDRGYFVYGPSGPQGSLSLTNVAQTLGGETPTAATNGTARLNAIDVVTGNSFQVRLDTLPVNLLGSIRDRDADGDNALLRIDAGVDANGSGGVDFTAPGGTAYGFESFLTLNQPGFHQADGFGQYAQTIDASALAEGMHFITARAFRHREDGGPAIFSDFRKSIYVDRLPAVSAVDSFNPITAGINENRRAVIRSVDQTADNVHVFLDLPAALTDAQVVAMVNGSSQATRLDRDLWSKDFGNLTHGNHVLTVVTFEITGRASVQRFAGQFTSTIFGAGLGDLDFDGDFDPQDVTLLAGVRDSLNAQFNPAGDLDGDGLVDNADLVRLNDRLIAVNASAATRAAFNGLLGPAASSYATTEGGGLNLVVNRPSNGAPPLAFAWDLDGDGVFADLGGPSASLDWADLEAAGIHDDGTYAAKLRVSAGSATTTFDRALTVSNAAPSADALSVVGTARERGPTTLKVVNATDPASADLGGLRYWFDIDGNGSFDDAGDVRNSASPTVQAVFPAEGMYAVRAEIRDPDGGVSAPYTLVVPVANVDLIVAGTGRGAVGRVRALDSVSGSVKFTVTPFGPSHRGGVSVASGDVTGDGVPDVIAGRLGVRSTRVKVFDGATGAELVGRKFNAFPGTNAIGVWVASGDVNGDGFSDIIVSAGPYGPLKVRVLSGEDGSELASITPFTGQRTGVRVAAGDVTGDGKADIVVSSQAGAIRPVKVFDGSTFGLDREIDALPRFAGGQFVAAGDLDGDGRAEVIVGQDSTSSARVRVFDGLTNAPEVDVTPFAGARPMSRGARVSVTDVDGDGQADVVVGGGGRPGRVKYYSGPELTFEGDIDPFATNIVGGVFVG